jgi:hypothetical protein
MDPDSARKAIHANLNSYCEQVARGNVLAFAELIDSPRTCVDLWLKGLRVPVLEGVLKAAKLIDVPVLSFYKIDGPSSMELGAAKCAFDRMNRGAQARRSSADIVRALEAANASNGGKNLSESARELGYSSPERLYQADCWFY